MTPATRTMNNKKRYTKNELTQLRLLFEQGKSDESIAAIMGRGVTGIQQKRRQLGLHRPDAVAISIKNGHHKWTKDELEFIRNYWRTKSDKWMAKKLGVSLDSYRQKRLRMKTLSLTGREVPARYIKRWTQSKGRHVTWTYNKEVFLRENYPTHSAKELAKYLGLKENAIQCKAYRMGLRKDYNPGRKGYPPIENYYSKETFKPKLID